MKKINISLLASGLILTALSGNALGEAGLSANIGPLVAPVTATVNLEINIAKVMLLRVGDWEGSSNTITWSNGFSAGLTDPKVNADATKNDWDNTLNANTVTATDDEAEADKAGDGALKVAAYGNLGADLNLKAVSTGFLPAGGPDLTDITVAAGGDIAHPDFNDATGVNLTHTDGVVRLEDTWTYQYTPAADLAGTYNAVVIYTLAAL